MGARFSRGGRRALGTRGSAGGRDGPENPDRLRGTVTGVSPLASDPAIVSVRVGRRVATRLLASDAAALGIEAGSSWDDDAAARAGEVAGAARARTLALRLLGRRSLSAGMLVDRLVRRGVDAPSARRVVEDLRARGLVNDAAFAESVVSAELARRPAGPRLLLSRLAARRVTGAGARAAVTEAMAGRDTAADALVVARRKAAQLPPGLSPDAAWRRVFGALARRGFDPETCGEAARAALGERRFGLSEDTDRPG